MKLSEVSIRRPVFATVLSLLLVILGLVSLSRLALREFPDVDSPLVSISTSYRGAGASIVENKITQLIEDRIAGVEGIDKLRSAGDEEVLAKKEPRQPFVPHAPGKPRPPRRRYSWAELMQRVFLVDVLTCPWCGGARKVLGGIFDPDAIHRILRHLGLPTEPPELAPARAPPEPLLPW